MNRSFENQLAHIRDALLLMSSLVLRNLSLAMRALMERDDSLADAAEAEDSQIDQLEMTIDDLVVTFMATQAPVARDCRFMLMAARISSNLERIGDQATKIARRARDLNREPVFAPVADLPVMADAAQEMLHDSITAFVEADVDLALEIIARDKTVDDLNRQVDKELRASMAEHSALIPRSLNLLIISYAIERVADHAANIAEDVIYLYRGEDIRHGGRQPVET